MSARPTPSDARARPKARGPDPSAPTDPRRQDARDRLLSVVCHDLRAPLAAVTMGANFLLQTTPDGDAAARPRRILEAMLRSCGEMERLIRNFGDLAEIDGGHLDLRLGVQDAGELLEVAAQTARESLAA